MSRVQKILDRGHFHHLLFSYNSEGLLSKDEILSVTELYGKTRVEEIDYPRFKSNAATVRTPLKELLLRLVLNFFCWQRQKRFSHGENRKNLQGTDGAPVV